MSGGLPAQGGLSVLANPMAQQLQSMGRDDDSVLVHMTPDEVNSLQGLAMSAGGSLTINPQTGLPEAFFLKKLLPTLLGGALAATGIGAPLAAGIVATGSTALTGNLRKGLMAGLGAFGGASLAGAAGLGGAISKTGFNTLSSKPGILGSNMGAGAATAPNLAGVKASVSSGLTQASSPAGAIPLPTGTIATPTGPLNLASFSGAAPAQAAIAPAAEVAQATAKAPGFFAKFGQTARQGLPGGMIGKAAPMVAGLGVLNAVSEATTPGFKTAGGQIDNSYQGPYTSQRREAQFAPDTADILGSSKERDYFAVDTPEIYNMQGQVVQPGTTTAPGTMIYQNVPNPRARKGQPMYSLVGTPFMGPQEEEEGFAEGGEIKLADGAFVIDARTVSEIGNGSSNAGIEALSRMGGSPVRGPGDGVSDSVRARIGRDQPARVARDEVIFQPEAVRRVGKGNPKRGAEKLYALMEKAHKARKKSERGKDTKLRKGLA
jgi:hypothetical protein